MSEGRSPEGERARGTVAEDGRISHVYVHVPFCRSRCSYCDFHALTLESAVPSAEVRRFRERALEVVADQTGRGVLGRVETVYFGGGTPTALGDELVALVAEVLGSADTLRGAEVTVEANPDSSDVELLDALRSAGVTRLSLGAQSFDDSVLRTLARAHDAERALRVVGDALRLGFEVSVDLMCGVPGQSFGSWESTLLETVDLGLEHVSVYPLGLEEGTPLDRSVRAGQTVAPDDDAAASMLELAERLLTSAGLARYEISNYAAPGRESRHNTAYWVGVPYLGVGPSAASMCGTSVAQRIGVSAGCGPDAARVRFAVAEGLVAFSEDTIGRLREVECLSERDAALEDVVLRLRLATGVDARQARAAGALGTLEEMERRGLLCRTGDRFRLDGRGWLLANEVFGAVWGLR